MDTEMECAFAELDAAGIWHIPLKGIIQHLFGGEELTAKEQEMLDYIIASGTHGTQKHLVENRMSKNGWSKALYFLNSFLAPINKNDSCCSIGLTMS